ncbi:MAG: biopolymer transporter ExbD [Pseudomonadota bacterium]
MALSSSSSDSDDVLSEINVTPLVDVMLVLLVAFIVTAPVLSSAIKVNLPKTVATQTSEPSQPLTLSVDAQGQLFLDQSPLAFEALESTLRARHADHPQAAVHLRSDESVNYGTVAKVMALVEKAGITKLAVLTSSSP